MFFCKVTATTECYPYGHTLSRHDALPILLAPARRWAAETSRGKRVPGDVAVIDIVAIVWLLVVWGSYNLIMDRLLMRRVGLNQYMKDVRRSWMLRMLDRDNRITDAAQIGRASCRERVCQYV